MTYLQGVIVQFRVMDGELRRGDLVKFMNTGCEYDITELGVLSPKSVEVRGSSVCLLMHCPPRFPVGGLPRLWGVGAMLAPPLGMPLPVAKTVGARGVVTCSGSALCLSVGLPFGVPLRLNRICKRAQCVQVRWP